MAATGAGVAGVGGAEVSFGALPETSVRGTAAGTAASGTVFAGAAGGASGLPRTSADGASLVMSVASCGAEREGSRAPASASAASVADAWPAAPSGGELLGRIAIAMRCALIVSADEPGSDVEADAAVIGGGVM